MYSVGTYWKHGPCCNVQSAYEVLFLQVCSAGSRLIVQESVADRVVAKIKERMTHLRVGDSLDKVSILK